MKRTLTTIIFTAVVMTAITGGAAAYDITTDSLYRHLSVLADDSLEGRRVGEPGEWKAAQYIKGVFESAGLQPGGIDGTWFQEFEFIKAIEFGERNQLTVNGQELQLNEEFIPMRQSASAAFSFDDIVFVNYGIAMKEKDGDYNDYDGLDVTGKAVVIKRFSPEPEDSVEVDFSRYESLTSKITAALDHDAAGVFFITPEDHDDTLTSMGPVRITPKDIPIVFLRRAALERLGLEISRPQIDAINGEAELIKVRDTGYNVVGFLPGEVDSTVVIGAHYDHLGWGGPGSGSRYLEKEPQIHNGADDNGSGSSVLLELARVFASRPTPPRHTMMFAAFSGEEFGILGSSHFAREMPIDSGTIRMMVNMDMIGRLQEQDKGLAVMGTGTTEAFGPYFDSLATGDIKITQKESGQGPSDHTAFYNRGIPVLMFFTGAHQDYHKPQDDIELIDFPGLLKVAGIVEGAIDHFDRYEGELTFVKTKDPDAGGRRADLSVTLGIMPDFITEVKGLKIDAVSPDRPADVAGLLKGDVITQLGDIAVGDIYDYMNALGGFRKGDTVIVTVTRGEENLDVMVVFE